MYFHVTVVLVLYGVHLQYVRCTRCEGCNYLQYTVVDVESTFSLVHVAVMCPVGCTDNVF